MIEALLNVLIYILFPAQLPCNGSLAQVCSESFLAGVYIVLS